MKRTLPKIIGATTLALGAQMAQGGEFINRPIELSLTEKQIRELCIQTQNNSHAIVNRTEVCEISTDNGKTWILLTAALTAGLFGTGYGQRKKIQSYMVRFLSRKKSDRNIMDGPEPVIIEPRLFKESPTSLISPQETRAKWVSRVKNILSKKSKPTPPWHSTVTITEEQVISEIRKEYEKRMQEMKNAFDTSFSDQDAMRDFYRQTDEMIKDGNHSPEEKQQLIAWQRILNWRRKDLEDFSKTLPVAPLAGALLGKNDETIITLTDVYLPALVVKRLPSSPLNTTVPTQRITSNNFVRENANPDGDIPHFLRKPSPDVVAGSILDQKNKQIKPDKKIPITPVLENAGWTALSSVDSQIWAKFHDMYVSEMNSLKTSYDLFKAWLISKEQLPIWLDNFDRQALAILESTNCSLEDRESIMIWWKEMSPHNAMYVIESLDIDLTLSSENPHLEPLAEAEIDIILSDILEIPTRNIPTVSEEMSQETTLQALDTSKSVHASRFEALENEFSAGGRVKMKRKKLRKNKDE